MSNNSKKLNFSKDHIKNIFDMIDINKDGYLEPKELNLALKELKVPPHFYETIYRKIDVNSDNKISFDEFINFVTNQTEIISDIFKKLDLNNDGKITIYEVKVFLDSAYPNNSFDEEVILHIFKKIDMDEDGLIDYDEWIQYLIFLPEINLAKIIEWSEEVTSLISDISEAPPLQLLYDNAKGEFKNKRKWFIDILCGGLSGYLSRTCSAPLERIKILMQVKKGKVSNMRDMIREIIKTEGYRSFWKGNLLNGSKNIIETSIKMLVFDNLKIILGKSSEKVSFSYLFLTGALSGLLSSFFVFPLDVLKTRLVASPNGHYKGVVDAFRQMYHNEGGFKSFFRGFHVSVCNSLPSAGFNLMIYELLKSSTLSNFNKQDLSVNFLMGIGSVSALFSFSLLYPFNLLTSRVIMQRLCGDKDSMFRISKTIYKENGILGFYSGFKPAVLKIFLGNAVAMGSYEMFKKILKKNNLS